MTVLDIRSGQISCALPWRATVGESPLWSVREQRLYWIDIQGKQIHRLNPATGANETFQLPEIVTSIGLRVRGGLVLTSKKQLALFQPDTGALETMNPLETGLANNRFNDGKCDPAGRYWAGTMDSKERSAPAGHLYRFDADLSPTTMQSEAVCSNGTGFSPDHKTMYFTESFRYTVFAYDFDLESGAISNRRVFASIDPKSGGFPDGLTVDADGFVWSNQVGLGQIHRYDPQGSLERMITLPVPRATACTFGGPELRTLFVTSARETMSPAALAAAPLSGSVFAVDCGVRGLASHEFAG